VRDGQRVGVAERERDGQRESDRERQGGVHLIDFTPETQGNEKGKGRKLLIRLNCTLLE
jgi:hypothetical protein